MSASTINLHSPPCLPLLGRNWFAKCEFTWAAFGEGEQTREYIRRVTGCVSRMGLGSAVTGQSATEKQGNINQDINPTHCAVSRGFRLFYCSRRVLKTTCLSCPRLYWSAWWSMVVIPAGGCNEPICCQDKPQTVTARREGWQVGDESWAGWRLENGTLWRAGRDTDYWEAASGCYFHFLWTDYKISPESENVTVRSYVCRTS